MVEFAIIATLAIIVMVVGVQFAMIGQAALAVSQGASALARYAAVNPGVNVVAGGGNKGNGAVTLTSGMEQLLSPSILSTGGADLTVTIASYSGTTTTTTDTPGFADRCVISLSYNANSKIALPNPFLGIPFPATLNASDSQMYE